MIRSAVHPSASLQKLEGSHDSTDFLGLCERPLEVVLYEVTDIECHMELRASLSTRTLRGGEKWLKFPSTTAVKTRRDIRHNRCAGFT